MSRRGLPHPKRLIKAKFTYLLHFSSFLDQTCLIDYDYWPNDIKFLFDGKCQIVTSQRLTLPKWVECSFWFQIQTYIIWNSFRRGVKQRKPFLARHIKPELWDFKEIWLHPPEPYFSLKNDPSDIFFTVFENKLIFRWHKPFIIGQNRIVLEFCFLTQKL